MVSRSGRYLDDLPLLDELPGGRHEVFCPPKALLDLQQLLKLVDLLHGIVGMVGRSGHQVECLCGRVCTVFVALDVKCLFGPTYTPLLLVS